MVVVMGLGRSGVAAARLALARGAARVVGVDTRTDLPAIPGVELELGPHRRQTFTAADWVVVSPGVPAAHPDLVAAQEAGATVISELGFAAQEVAGRIVAVTGTNGKSTVTSFTAALLQAPGRRVFAGGNLGIPLSEAVLGDPYDVYVIEVSSYQMELPGGFAPDVAVVLNLTPDHLGRHGTMEVYGRTKGRVFQRQPPGGWAFLPADDAQLRAWIGQVGAARRATLGALPGVVRQGRAVTVQLDGDPVGFDLSAVTVPGAHNLDHAATALALACAVGGEAAQLQAQLATLEALPHRMQPVSTRGGHLWINDSKATNVEAAAVGIAGLDGQAVVLLGGEAKGPGFAALAPALMRHRAVITFGASGPAIAAELAGEGVACHQVGSLQDAVALSERLAAPHDAILLSPGCASFDAFTNFEHRGRVFAALAQGEAA